jgi:hypothetical protein
VVDALICLVNDLAALQAYDLELGIQVLVFRGEERVKDGIFNRRSTRTTPD